MMRKWGKLAIGILEDIKNGLSKAKNKEGENASLFYIKTRDDMKELKEINSLNEYIIPFFQNNNFVKEGIIKKGQVSFLINKKYDEVYSDNGINNIFIQNLGIEKVEVLSPNLEKPNKELIRQFTKNGCEVIVKLGEINKNGKLKRKSQR